MGQPASQSVSSLQDIGRLFAKLEPETGADEKKVQADGALTEMTEDESAKLVSWLGSKAVKEKFEALGIQLYPYGVSGYAVLVGTTEAWERTYRERLKAYYTVAWWDAERGRWEEKKRPKPKRWPPRFRNWVNRCNAQSEDRFSRQPWSDFFGEHPETFDEGLERKFEALIGKEYATVNSVIGGMTYDMQTRWAQVAPGSEVFEDRKTGKRWKVRHFGPVWVPGNGQPEPKNAWRYATEPERRSV